MNKTAKIIIATASAAVVLASGIFLAIKFIPMFSNSDDGSGNVDRLGTPTNLSFDSINYVLSWDSVSHADGYNISINGKIYKAETNSFYCVPNSKTTTFKVQSTDSTNAYVSSNWSTECTYTIPNNEVSLASLNAFASGMSNSFDTENVVSIYAEGNHLYTAAKYDNGKVYLLENEYNSNVTSLKNIIFNNDYGVSSAILSSYEFKEYNSISYYLQSDVYEGTLQEYRDQGYEFNVIVSQSYKVSSTGMGVYTLFKLTKNDDTKYVHSSLYFVVEDTQNEKVKYTTALVNLASNYIREYACVELTGDFIDYAKVIENAQVSAK